MQSLANLPHNLPEPVNDGACDHLANKSLPSCILPTTDGNAVNLSEIKGWLVIYCYPMTGKPGVSLPNGWEQIPGARGCTPQACSFRDHYEELQRFHVSVYGLSAQTTEYQREAASRLHLPFALLSDADFKFTEALQLPTFQTSGMRLNRRVTLIAFDGIIQHYFYPVFPPDKNIDQILTWFKDNAA